MVTKTYTVPVLSSKVRSDLREETSPPLADFYLHKSLGWLNITLEENDTTREASLPLLFEKKSYRTYTTFKTNTLNFDLTDKSLNGVFYRYRLMNAEAHTELSLRNLLRSRDIVQIGSGFYTNSLLYDEESKIYSECLFTLEDCEVLYRSKYIEIKAPENTEILFKPSVLSPTFINEHQVHIPSFYLIYKDKTIRCVESNIMYNIEEEYNTHPSYPLRSIQKGASKALSLLTEGGEYQLMKSTHCFSLPSNKTTFYIHDNGHISTDPSNISFNITKSVDLNKISVVPNKYKRLTNDTNIDDYLYNTVVSYKETNADINSAYLNYIENPRGLPVYRYVNDINMVGLQTLRKDRPYLGRFSQSQYSSNDHPLLLDVPVIEDLDTVDGITFLGDA